MVDSVLFLKLDFIGLKVFVFEKVWLFKSHQHKSMPVTTQFQTHYGYDLSKNSAGKECLTDRDVSYKPKYVAQKMGVR